MKYAIVDTVKAEAAGFTSKYRLTSKDGSRLALNENELLRLDADPAKAAEMLGGKVMGLVELKMEIMK